MNNDKEKEEAICDTHTLFMSSAFIDIPSELQDLGSDKKCCKKKPMINRKEFYMGTHTLLILLSINLSYKHQSGSHMNLVTHTFNK